MNSLIIGLGGLAAGLIGSFISADAATSAADTQASAARAAAANSQATFQQIRNDLLPYMIQGYGAIPKIAELTGTGSGGNPLTAPLTSIPTPNDATLDAIPGFAWAKKQGGNAVTNALTAQGLGGISGPQLKGLMDYNTGLAQNAWGQYFNQQQQAKQQTYNMLLGLTQGGQNAAAQTANFGTQAANSVNANNTSAAAAQAAGTVGAANAWSNAVGQFVPNVMSAYLMTNIYPKMFNQPPPVPGVQQ